MLTRTTEAAIQSLIYLVLQDREEPVSPRQIAKQIDLSPTYLAKVANLLVKANILRAFRGAQGGVVLARPARTITLLEIVEACQGQVVGDFCREVEDLKQVCAFHNAMLEVHQALIGVLSKWTLADLAAQPHPKRTALVEGCRMGNVCCEGMRV